MDELEVYRFLYTVYYNRLYTSVCEWVIVHSVVYTLFFGGIDIALQHNAYETIHFSYDFFQTVKRKKKQDTSMCEKHSSEKSPHETTYNSFFMVSCKMRRATPDILTLYIYILYRFSFHSTV